MHTNETLGFQNFNDPNIILKRRHNLLGINTPKLNKRIKLSPNMEYKYFYGNKLHKDRISVDFDTESGLILK